MISLADVGDDRHVALVETKTFPEDSATSHFEDGGIQDGIQQNVSSTSRPGTITQIDRSAIDDNAIGTGQTDGMSRDLQQRSDQTGDRCLAIRSGDGQHAKAT